MEPMTPKRPDPLPKNKPTATHLEDDMEQPKEPKSPAKSLTIWGIIATIAAAFATMIGLDPDLVKFLEDGLQWTDVTAIATLIGALVIYIGRKRASGPLKRLFG